MNLRYCPLLPIQRELQSMPRNEARFREYLRTILRSDRSGPELTPLLLANPMARDHVTGQLDALIALDADGIAAKLTSELASEYPAESGDYDVSLVVVDDLRGGFGTGVIAESERVFRRISIRPAAPRWQTRAWLYGVLWSSDPVTVTGVPDAVSTAIHRAAYLLRNGPPRTLREMLRQEGCVLLRSGTPVPVLDAEELEYTREVIRPFLDCGDLRTAVECLFGDSAGETLGFTSRGLSYLAGLSLAVHDASSALPSEMSS
jgi:hypothetical protein